MGAATEVARAAPLAAAKRRSTTLLHLLQLENPDGVFVFTLPPPSPEPEAETLIDKIGSCCRVFAFSDAGEPASERDAKRERLSEVLDAVRSSSTSIDTKNKQQPAPGLDHRVMAALVKMLAANLFREMPPPPPSASCPLADAPAAIDEESPAVSLLPSWPHLQAVYDILLAMVAGAGDDDATKSLRHHLDRRFLASLVSLFASDDPRERDRLKTAYHMLYSKLTPDRAFMRRSMAAALLRFAHHDSSSSSPAGVGELLEICGSIINGFAVPLKEEHRGFLLRVLMPLHRTRWLHAYHRQLVYCVLQFVHKEPALVGAVVQGILRRWPVTNCQKEVLLIDELEEIVEVLQQDQFDALAVPICSRIARCATSCSSQVAERALYVWNNERFLELACSSSDGGATMERILPAFVASIEDNLERHWSKCVRDVTGSVKALLQQMAPEMYARCAAGLAASRAEADADAAARADRWRRIEAAAAANAAT